MDWHAKVKHKSTSMQAGKNYTVVFWAKAKKMREVSLSIQMQRDPWTFYQGGKFNLTAEWKEYSKTFKSNDNVDRDMWVGLSMAQSDIDFWLDKFRFFEGELKDEIGRDQEEFPVSTKDKLPMIWGKVKAQL
ncbi:MAG: carbohydrate binding domain-containing protein [Candidatus Poribacteria bacterium]|nr:carbohydrate binding domain-containing protein [Candidatus Poribacteria bacterium]